MARPEQRLGLGPFRVDSRLSRPATNGQGEFRAGVHAQSARPAGAQFQDGHRLATALEGDYALAAGLAQRVVEKNPEDDMGLSPALSHTRRWLGTWLLLVTRFGRLRAANPGVAVTMMTTSHPLRSVSRLFDVLAQGWRLAGLLEEN